MTWSYPWFRGQVSGYRLSHPDRRSYGSLPQDRWVGLEVCMTLQLFALESAESGSVVTISGL